MRQTRARLRVLEERGQSSLGFSVEDMTRVPVSDWEPPDLSLLPDRLAGVVGVDTETDDNGLRAGQGPGWAWAGGGRMVGYSVAADNCRVYLPIGHAEGNVDPDRARRWLNHVLGDPTQTKVFANAMYDIGWARTDGVEISGPVVDVQMVEALLDEHRFTYELDAIARDRVGRGKNDDAMVDAGRAYELGDSAKKVRINIARLPSRHVGPYAEEDAQLPREMWAVQASIVKTENLEDISALEHALLPMYLDMRRRGVRVDVSHVEEMRGRMISDVKALIAEIRRLTGVEVSIWESQSIARVLDHLGVSYGRTPRSGEPQVTNELLETAAKEGARACALLFEARQKDKLRGTFLEGQLLNLLHAGRVHGQIHPLKSSDDDKRRHGTVTGRLSMSTPNLQFIPKRTREGKQIRLAFLPEDGEKWGKLDNSQQEVRLLVHFAVLSSRSSRWQPWIRAKLSTAAEAARRYADDPTLDYHRMVSEITGLPRERAKGLNFAIIYGRGVNETARELGLSYDETKRLFEQHAEKMPFARQTSKCCQDRVREVGYLRTLLGRRQRFPFWEPADYERRTGQMLPLEEARRRWPGEHLSRARIHKSLNALVQPSAADQTKKAMLDVWRAGLGRHVMIQVHDELDVSVGDRATAARIAEAMRDAVKLEVPVVIESKFGPNWGSCE